MLRARPLAIERALAVALRIDHVADTERFLDRSLVVLGGDRIESQIAVVVKCLVFGVEAAIVVNEAAPAGAPAPFIDGRGEALHKAARDPHGRRPQCTVERRVVNRRCQDRQGFGIVPRQTPVEALGCQSHMTYYLPNGSPAVAGQF